MGPVLYFGGGCLFPPCFFHLKKLKTLPKSSQKTTINVIWYSQWAKNEASKWPPRTSTATTLMINKTLHQVHHNFSTPTKEWLNHKLTKNNTLQKDKTMANQVQGDYDGGSVLWELHMWNEICGSGTQPYLPQLGVCT